MASQQSLQAAGNCQKQISPCGPVDYAHLIAHRAALLLSIGPLEVRVVHHLQHTSRGWGELVEFARSAQLTIKQSKHSLRGILRPMLFIRGPNNAFEDRA